MEICKRLGLVGRAPAQVATVNPLSPQKPVDVFGNHREWALCILRLSKKDHAARKEVADALTGYIRRSHDWEESYLSPRHSRTELANFSAHGSSMQRTLSMVLFAVASSMAVGGLV